jgi:hypothetical protein
MMTFYSALALNIPCASKCVPGGFLGIPPARGRRIKFTVGNWSPDNVLIF